MSITMGAYIDGGGHVSGHMKDVAQCEGIDRLLVTGSEEARSIAAEMPKAEFVEDWEALLGRPDVPAVIVLTSNRAAGRLTLQAVEAGTWVYGEKPGARTAAEMRAIVEACERTGARDQAAARGGCPRRTVVIPGELDHLAGLPARRGLVGLLR